jgi:hypothetical protein
MKVGGGRLEVTLNVADAAAVGALAPFVAGEIHVSHDGRRLRAPVSSGDGLATTIVRALDEAGITVDDVALYQPSLDDVFFALTGHPAAEATEDEDVDDRPSGSDRPSEPDKEAAFR